jgi:hypothetical protein
MDWQHDKSWADGYWPAIEAVIRAVAGQIISVSKADDEMDVHQATDYVVRVSAGEIACRVRRPGYTKFHDFTLRCSRPSGVITELEKIRQGFAKWYLYAWAMDAHTFEDWVFVDLDKLRGSGLLTDGRQAIMNWDGSSAFVAFSLEELRNGGCILAVRADGAAQA